MALIEEVISRPLILVVDDDLDLCSNLWDLLREHGYRVCIANDVARAVSQIHDDKYEVILLDLKLPDGDGSQVLQSIQKKTDESHVIMITGCINEFPQQARDFSCNSDTTVFYKPLDVSSLLKTLNALIS